MATSSRILWNNTITASGVTISSSSQVTNYPDDNVGNRARWKIWRSSTSTSDQWVKFYLGSNQTVKCIFVVNYKAHTGGDIIVQAHTSDSWATPVREETLTLPSPDLTGVAGAFFTSASLDWVRVFFDNVASANEYVELGCVFAGDYLEPTDYQVHHEFGLQRVDPSQVVYALDGQEESQQRTKFFRLDGEFRFAPDADRDSFQEAFDTVGGSIPFWFALSPTDADLQFYGRFVETLQMDHKQIKAGSSWSIPFDFVESR